MRAWLYDHLTTDPDLIGALRTDVNGILTRVMPRVSQDTINIPKPFLVYGLGNNTNEDLAEDNDHEAHRQFFQVWIHDEGGDYGLIDDMVEIVKGAFQGKNHPPSNVTQVRWLETSGEFANETYNTIFRYVRFQAIISKGAVLT
jgi:hypothetical protein